jgi:hypothetical protein
MAQPTMRMKNSPVREEIAAASRYRELGSGSGRSMSALKRITDSGRTSREVRKVPCVDGSELARTFFTFAALVGAAMCSACRCGSHDR